VCVKTTADICFVLSSYFGRGVCVKTTADICFVLSSYVDWRKENLPVKNTFAS